MRVNFDASDLSWIDELADNDYVVIDDFLALALLREVNRIFNLLIEQDELKKAGIGSIDYQIVSEVRGDFIHWIDQKETH